MLRGATLLYTKLTFTIGTGAMTGKPRSTHTITKHIRSIVSEAEVVIFIEKTTKNVLFIYDCAANTDISSLVLSSKNNVAEHIEKRELSLDDRNNDNKL